jgi:hypothetical protein
MCIAPATYRLLGGEARLRLLRVLRRERLNVTETARHPWVSRSRVCRGSGLLKEAGWVAEEKDAGYCHASPRQ